MAQNTKPEAPADKPASKPEEYIGSITLETGAFTVDKPELLDRAEQMFRKQIKEIKGADAQISDVRLIQINHHIGIMAIYKFSAVVK